MYENPWEHIYQDPYIVKLYKYSSVGAQRKVSSNVLSFWEQ